MSYKNIDDIPIITHIWLAITSLMSGVIAYARAVKREGRKGILMFLFSIVNSAFFSVMTFLALVGYGFNEVFAVGVAGMVAAQADKLPYYIEKYIEVKAKK
jgi:hypothetical protein